MRRQGIARPRRTFIAEVVAFGGKLHAVPPDGPASRSFAVTIEAGPRLLGKLVVRDVWDEETVRSISPYLAWALVLQAPFTMIDAGIAVQAW